MGRYDVHDGNELSELYIGGEWRSPHGKEVIEVENPATLGICATVPSADPEDVDDAVAAANDAFPSWSSAPVAERRRVLEAFVSALSLREEEIARAVTTEMGAPLQFSRDVQAAFPIHDIMAGFLEAMPELEYVEKIGNSRVVREAAGVVAAITPWNYPVHQALIKIGAALAAGCPVVFKPSQVSPLSAYLITRAAHEAGLPAGVLNLVTGTGRTVGGALAAHPGVDVVSFTGSTDAGRQVAIGAAGTIKRVGLELGGKSANVVLPDADLERAVRRGTDFLLENTGQTCSAWTRMLVPRDRQDEVIDLVRQVMAAQIVGQPTDPATTMGPLATADQRDTVLHYIAQGTNEGARLVHGGPDRPAGNPTGHFVVPTAFADVTPDMVIAREEIFGPVLTVLPYDDEDEALRMANDSIYGLSGAVWAGDEERAVDFARKLRTGQVSINGGSFNPRAPFGGYKQSGIGREIGRYGFEDFLETKAMQF